MSPPPADFTDKDDACCGGDTGPGDFYYRILRGWPGTGMENFGDRLSVDDIWRVVLFVKTIPNGTLDKNVVPEPKDYITWQPSKELLAWVKTRQKLENNVVVHQEAQSPTRSCRRRCASSRASRPATASSSTTARRRSRCRTPRPGSRRSTSDLLDRAWADAERAATSCRRSQKDIPPTCRGSNEARGSDSPVV